MKNKFHIKCKKLPSVETLLEFFIYDKKTGKLFNQKKRKGTTYEQEAGFITNGYRELALNNKRYLVHRLIWKIETGKDPRNSIDHINGDKLDNRFSNLREVSHKENTRNQKMRSTNTSGIMGVSFDKHANKWMAHITVNGKFIFLGRFKDKEEAAKSRKKAEILHGFSEKHGRI